MKIVLIIFYLCFLIDEMDLFNIDCSITYFSLMKIFWIIKVKREVCALFSICILRFQHTYSISVDYFLLLHDFTSYFSCICFSTDHYMIYLYIHNRSYLQSLTFPVIKDPTKVRGKHQMAGFVLTICWLMRRRPSTLIIFGLT